MLVIKVNLQIKSVTQICKVDRIITHQNTSDNAILNTIENER